MLLFGVGGTTVIAVPAIVIPLVWIFVTSESRSAWLAAEIVTITLPDLALSHFIVGFDNAAVQSANQASRSVIAEKSPASSTSETGPYNTIFLS